MAKILIVDDNECNREVLLDALHDEGYEIRQAGNGREAIRLVEEDHPDLILLDILMPEMDGVETLEYLKGKEETRHIPVIMVTALGMDSQVATCLDAGAADYIVKPFSSLVVRARVRTAVRNGPSVGDLPAAEVGTEKGKIYSFIGGKGGVGTTTVAINIAYALTKMDKSITVVELRSCWGAVASQLRLTPRHHLGTLLEDSETKRIDPHQLQQCLIEHPSGFKVLCGPQKAGSQIEITPQHVETLVNLLCKNADCVILDLPSYITPCTETIVKLSDFVSLVTELEPSSVDGAKHTLDWISSLSVEENLLGAIVNSRARVSSAYNLGNVRSSLTCGMMGVIPADPDACMMAVRGGRPVLEVQPDATISGALTSLAERISQNQVAPLAF